MFELGLTLLTMHYCKLNEGSAIFSTAIMKFIFVNKQIINIIFAGKTKESILVFVVNYKYNN